MGGAAILSSGRIAALCIAALLALILPSSKAEEAPVPAADSPAFSLRVIAADLDLPSPELRRQLRFYRELGFNAFLIESGQAGKWTEEQAPRGPVLDERFRDLVSWCEAEGVAVYVSIDPQADTNSAYAFTDPASRKRLRKFLRILRRKAGIHDFVLSFRKAPLRLINLRDIVHYGLSAAPAHIELAADLFGRLRPADRLWLLPAVSSDVNLDNSDIRYSSALLQDLGELDPHVGIVWSGPASLSPSISADQVEQARARMGGRRLLLQDRYSIGPEGDMVLLALALGPLRNREPGIAAHLDGYLYRPMSQRGGSNLSLMTVADFLRDPFGYDPESSWTAAMRRLAGENEAAFQALKTQATEWGGWIQERNYRSILLDNPVAAAESLRDPAAVARWGWTARRYAERMALLSGLNDEPFREELLDTMARRLAVARAIPTVRELRSRIAAGRTDTDQLVAQLRSELAAASGSAGVRRALERFLAAAGLATPADNE